MRRLSPRLGLAAMALWLSALPPAIAGETITDSAGRKIELPARVARVFAAGPPASVVAYMLAPQAMVGWVRRPRPAELTYLLPSVRDLPETGRLTGRGDTANIELVMSAKPDLIVDFGSATPTFVSLANRVQEQTAIPYVLVDGHFANTVAGLRLLGRVLGVPERGERLARRAEEILGEVDRVVQSVPVAERPRVYFARGTNGLETGNRGSINTEIIERAGGVNVVDAGLERGGLVTVSVEQVLSWNPDTIITIEQGLVEHLRAAPGWSEIAALKQNRLFVSPGLPWSWIDFPPSANRLLGLQWLARLFFPGRFSDDVRSVTKEFYATFYQVELGDADLDRLLQVIQSAH